MDNLLLHDQSRRELFRTGISSNASLIAPAGVGKTHSIIDRIIHLACGKNPNAADWLPRLVVVTYTKSAAEEMRRRARNAIITAGAQGAALAHFNRAFFGTIHSFCMMLLERHGHHLGLPSGLVLAEDVVDLWQQFLRSGEWRIQSLPEDAIDALFRIVPMLDVLRLGRTAPDLPCAKPGKFPTVDAGGILSFKASGNGKKNALRGQDLVRRWLGALDDGHPFMPLPECPGGGAEFERAWAEAFRPLREWLGAASWTIAREVASTFRGFRLSRGQMTYDDQVALAAELMRHPRAGAAIRAEGYRVILDEAQDTDREQFVVLTEVAREPGATGIWMDGSVGGPAPGRFAMVGDPQQSIYGSRASLASYAALRKKLLEEGGVEVSLDVTFRFKSKTAEFVNSVGPRILNGLDGQAEYVRLETTKKGGGVIRWHIPRPTDRELGIEGTGKRATDVPLGRAEAAALARRLVACGPRRLGAADWSGVAVLCPRRAWLETLEEAIVAEGLDVQNHSVRQSLGGSAAYAWFSSLIWIMAEPRDGFEIAGVLREIFGLADADIAEFTGGDGDRLRLVGDGALETPGRATGIVAETMRNLAALRAGVMDLPLGRAVRRIVADADLRKRIEALPKDEWDPTMLDVLLFRATAAEEEGLTLAEWAETLRAGFASDRDGESVRSNAIQLITCHKAKGLQWDCVILPFLCRPVGNRTEQYPRLVPLGPTEVPAVIFGRGELGDAREQALLRGEEQEMQRLLYVAMTRSKNTLVIVDDRDVFERRSKSFFERGRFDDDGLEKLGTDLRASHVPSTDRDGDEKEPVIEPVAIDWAGAIQSASAFPRRILPHALVTAEAAKGDAEPEMGLATFSENESGRNNSVLEAAAEYGIWWHAMMQDMPWQGGIDEWRRCLASHMPACPKPDRGALEFELLAASPFVSRIVQGAKEFRTELPFLWREGEASCLEGVMDFVVWDTEQRSWAVVDWKTNSIAKGELPHLATLYRPQLTAYASALEALTPQDKKGPSVKAYLYSTMCGEAVEI